MSKKIIIPSLALALAVLVAAGVSQISAQESDYNFPPAIEKLVEHFGLNEEEVQGVIDEVRADHFAQMQTILEERLTEAVENGQLTEEQKVALLNKHEEMHQERFMNREELRTWAEDNGIELKYLFPAMGQAHHGRFMHHIEE